MLQALLVWVNVAAFSLPLSKDSGVHLVSPEGTADLLTAWALGGSTQWAEICLPHPAPFPRLGTGEQRTISPHDSLCFHLTSTSRQKTAARPLRFLVFFSFLSREKAIYHLRRLTVLTIFQPFWHRFFWNCLKTSATLVALFKCTSRESFRRSDAWTFTILEGWTRQKKRKKVLKERLLKH